MNLAQEKRRRLASVHLRVPPEIREKAKDFAHKQSTDQIRITESDVYRKAITLFFESLDTKRIQD